MTVLEAILFATVALCIVYNMYVYQLEKYVCNNNNFFYNCFYSDCFVLNRFEVKQHVLGCSPQLSSVTSVCLCPCAVPQKLGKIPVDKCSAAAAVLLSQLRRY